MKAYFSRLFLVLDMLLNVVAFGQVETISSRAGKAIAAGKRCILCKLICGLLDMRWKDHCAHNQMDPIK